jgi:hypothetical protein
MLRGERLVATRRGGKQAIHRIASPAAMTALGALHGLFCGPNATDLETQAVPVLDRSMRSADVRAKEKLG